MPLAGDLLLVLLRPEPAAGLLIERGGRPAVPLAGDLLLVLLRPEPAAGLLIERGGRPAVPLAGDLLLVLLRPGPPPACSLNAAVGPPCPSPVTCCSFCCVPARRRPAH